MLLLVLVLVALLCWGFHTCGNTFSITFAPNSVACGVQPNILCSKAWCGIHVAHVSLEYVLVCFAWAAGKDEVDCKKVNSF